MIKVCIWDNMSGCMPWSVGSIWEAKKKELPEIEKKTRMCKF